MTLDSDTASTKVSLFFILKIKIYSAEPTNSDEEKKNVSGTVYLLRGADRQLTDEEIH